MIGWRHAFRIRLKQRRSRSKLKTGQLGKHPASPTNLETTTTHYPQPISPNLFAYEPLETSQRHIRLVRVLQCAPSPYAGDGDNDLNCTIETFKADEAPPYIALSYTWGAPSPTRTIQINGKRFSVRENLYNFLNTFKFHDHATYSLWIDQLCIDHTNTSERNQQIGMMTNIYRKCCFVLSWLDQTAQRAAQDLKSGKDQNVDQVAFESLNRLLLNRYFSRLWIVQEVLLAPRVQIVCGDIWLEWNHIRRAILALSWHRRDRLPDAMLLFRMKEEKAYCVQTHTLERGIRLSLGQCLTLYSSLKCEDYRDKVYGLLGLVHGDSERPELDYSKSLQVVYLDTVKILLAQDQLKYTLQHSARAALLLSRNMGFSKRDLKALNNLFRDISELSTIDAIGLKSSKCPTIHWWWYESRGERFYYYSDGKFLEMTEVVGAGQNLSYNISKLIPGRPTIE